MVVAQKIAPSKINEQVLRIVKTPEFKKSKVLSNFLKYIVKETLDGKEQTLKEYVIATEVLKKSSDFNPQLDAVVRIHARRLRKFLEDYYSGDGAADTLKISIPKGRYIPLFEQNFSSDSHFEKAAGPTDLKIESIPTVAIMPFRNLEGIERSNVICSILCQDLTVELSKSPEIKVISNHSTEFAIKHLNSNKDISAHLGADYLITGSCFPEENDLNISVELHHTTENQVIWAKSLEIKDYKKNILKEYKEVVKRVVARTCGYFGIIYRNTINNHIPQDYDTLYAVYWHNKFHQNFSYEAFQESTQALDKALSVNPDNSLLLSLKAEFFLNLCAMDMEGDTDCFREGSTLVAKAIALDPNSQHAWQVYGWAKLLEKNIKEYDLMSRKCLSINPYNAMYMASIGFGDQCAGEYERGLELMLESIDLNPFAHWVVNLGFSLYYYHKNYFEEALYWARLIKRPGLIWDPLLRAASLGQLNRTDEARLVVKELFEMSPNFADRATHIVSRFIFEEALHKSLLQGLKKAGIDISPTS